MARADRDRFDQLAPRDVAITLRSLHRRLASIEARASAPELEDLIGRPGPSGQPLDELLADALRGAGFTASALTASLTATAPVLPEAVFDLSERTYVEERSIDLETAVEAISSEADEAAQRIEHATASELSRSVAVVGGTATTPLAIGQQLARELIGALAAAERHVDWLESQA